MKGPKPHHWVHWGAGGRRSTVDVARPLCVYCGLLHLRNAVSDAAAYGPCPGSD